MAKYEIGINSNVFNTLEYVLFDLVLALIVYVLTSKFAGLYNCYDALENHRKSHICEGTRAPLFETGIVCTKKKVFYIIVAIRILSWILIFSTNLFIRGSSRKIREETTASVVTLGRFSSFDPYPLMRRKQLLRKSCMTRTKNSSYYGEIRNGSCETDERLFSTKKIEFGLEFKPTDVSVDGCTPRNRTYASHALFKCNNSATPTTILPSVTSSPSIICTWNRTGGVLGEDLCFLKGVSPFVPCSRKAPRLQIFNISFDCGVGGITQKLTCRMASGSTRRFSLCNNAVIACPLRPKSPRGYECSGLVNINETTHICQDLELGNQKNTIAKCKSVAGAEWNITDWVSYFGVGTIETISEIIPIAYGAGVEKQQVFKYSTKGEHPLTTIDVLWAVALAAKILMVATLYVTCEVFSRHYGVFVVANDESRILSLLRTTVIRIRHGRNAITGRNDIKLRVALQNGVVHVHDAEEEVGDAPVEG